MNPPAPQTKTQIAADDSRAPQSGIPRRRWMIALLLGAGVLVNYFDRVNVSVSQRALHDAFGVTTVQFGYLLSAFNWTYMLLQVPSGLLLDRFGVSRVGRVGALLWSVACFCSASSIGMWTFLGSRLLLGVGEAPTFPGCAKAVGYWFPQRERSLATAYFDGAGKLGAAIGVPLIGLLLLRFGWRASFAATGLISFFYFILFAVFYRNPNQDRGLSETERQFILNGGAHVEAERARRERIPVSYLLSQRKVWGLLIGYGAYNYTFYLLLLWLPSYLSMALGIDLQHSVLYTSVPWAIGAATDLLVGGWLVNALILRGWDSSRVRQSVLVIGTGLGLGIIGAARARSPHEALFWISLCMAGLSASGPVGWSIPALLAPERGVGTLGGLLNTCNQLAGIAAPIATAYIVAATQSFAWAFATAAVILLLGIAAYIFWLGRIEPLPDPAA